MSSKNGTKKGKELINITVNNTDYTTNAPQIFDESFKCENCGEIFGAADITEFKGRVVCTGCKYLMDDCNDNDYQYHGVDEGDFL